MGPTVAYDGNLIVIDVGRSFIMPLTWETAKHVNVAHERSYRKHDGLPMSRRAWEREINFIKAFIAEHQARYSLASNKTKLRKD